ncbi:uncharacterized protein EKO05_0007353 [Ascochyta rabiei]|uniref:uncharacterized protein n=1 Tax=Didymella rabiei TaxID=5454 RepID=UPI0021FCC660|nr:uncharacterized protein EKO05_0007353 [Ascochyta rabiei]UPX16974.1 hypothetical protein EKO05_0007353 [Ascochyta rabiei]
MGGIVEWKKHIELCFALVKPEAWIEIQEPDVARFLLPPSGNAYDAFSKTPALEELKRETSPIAESWRDIWHNLMWHCGLKPRVGALLANYPDDTDLEEIRTERYVLPSGTWEGMADAQRRMASIHEAFARDNAPVLIRRLGSSTGYMSSEEIDRVAESSRTFVGKFEGNRELRWVYVVCGRKKRIR